MLGWLILFALLAMLSPLMGIAGTQTLAPQIGGVLFGSLFCIGVAARLVRGRAR